MKISLKKKYITGMGHRVTHMKIVPKNSAGRLVTYPVKGTVIVRENPLKIEQGVWTMEGIENVVWGDESDNLFEDK